jgi:hypothetical protein
MHFRAIEQKAMRLFFVAFIVGIALASISSVMLFPFNQILLTTGFSSIGFGFGLLGTLSIMQEYESNPKPLS